MVLTGRFSTFCMGFALVGCYAQTSVSPPESAPADSAKSKSNPELTAREVFYVALDANTGGGVAKPVRQNVVKHKPKAVATTGGDFEPPPAPRTEAPRLPDNPRPVRVSNSPSPALGLKYSISRYSNGGLFPIDPDAKFHSNDQIQLAVEVSSPGYLYVVSRGASGRWITLFPNTSGPAEANHLQPGQSYNIPPGERSVITFHDPAGKEQLFLFLSRQPVSSSEDLMMQMSGNGGPSSSSTPAEGSEPGPIIEALNRMGDSDIGKLSRVYGRDLMVEKASGDPEKSSSPASSAPKALSMYVVDPSGSLDSHVVANITLSHE